MTQFIELGAWSLFADLAGQVSVSPQNPIVTAVAVGVPIEIVRSMRTRLRHGFQGAPVKWKRGGLKGLATVVQLLVRQRLPVAVCEIFSDDTRWQQYFDQAEEFMQEARARGQRLKYLDGANVLRMHFLGIAFASVVGRILHARRPEGGEPAHMGLEMIADNDLAGEESRREFADTLTYWGRVSAMISMAGVTKTVTARCCTEEQEPLLLLADYLAGVYHHADPRARLACPVVSPDEASLAVHDLRRRHGAQLYECLEDFERQYPLKYEGGQVVKRRGGGTAC